MTPSFRLSQLPAGSRAEIRAVAGHPAFRGRMLALGITPGAPLLLIRRMPMGGPLEIEVRGTRIALRMVDADRITVAMRA